MLSKTLQDGLSDYRIGDTIRTLRLKKKIGLVELGTHTGLSPALLSKIERGRLFPTLPTLLPSPRRHPQPERSRAGDEPC